MLTIESKNNIKKLINPFKKEWINVYDTNCYTYSLGLDAPLKEMKCMYLNIPGRFDNIDLKCPFTLNELLYNLESDLRSIGISYIEVNPDFIINKDGFKKEWKIALMATRQYTRDFSQIYNDFHFLRQTENGIWTHKKGYRKEPTDIDSRYQEIKDPIKAIVETDGFYSSDRYEYIKTYCLKK